MSVPFPLKRNKIVMFKSLFKGGIFFKKLCHGLIIFSLVSSNLTWATQGIIDEQDIIELDVQGSQTPHLLHTIPRLSNVQDIRYIEIKANQQQVIVHRVNPHAELQLEEGRTGLSPVTTPILLQKWDVQGLLWDKLLDMGKLKSFLLHLPHG